MKKSLLLLIGTILFSSLLWAQEVTNVTASQRTDGSKLLDVFYDLAGTEAQYTVSLEISFDDGQTFEPVIQVSGDVGTIEPATGLQIVWDAGIEFPNGFYSETMKVKLVADTMTSWQCGDILVDSRDGSQYETVKIVYQCWMAENLNVGARIDGIDNQTDNGTIEKYCFDNDSENCELYGGLYQWDELMQYTSAEGAQGICPEGWHIPTDLEWKKLEGLVDSEFTILDPEWDGTGYRGFDVGKNLKSTSGWDYGGNGTDQFEFNAKPGGIRTYDGSFYYWSTYGYWWTSTYTSGFTDGPWYRRLEKSYDYSYRKRIGTSSGISVRCVEDLSTQNPPPQIPNNPKPENESLDVPIEIPLKWQCADYENESLLYDIKFGTSSTPSHVATGILDTIFYPGILEYNTLYFWQIVAHDTYGNITVGPVWSFTTGENQPSFKCGNTLVDTVDGKEYETIQIGDQCWMAENLNIGIRIEAGNNQTDNGIIEKYCYNNNEERCAQYGGLYQWDEMMGYQVETNSSTICPTNWNIPSIQQWESLILYAGGFSEAGSKLKSTITEPSPHPRWNSPNHGATDEFNFSGFPGGLTSGSSSYSFYIGEYAVWWSSSLQASSDAWQINLGYLNSNAFKNDLNKNYGASVRCVTDVFLPNLPPSQPSNPTPNNNSINQSTDSILQWECIDPDGDSLTFDIYFGIEAPPALFHSGCTNNYFDPGQLSSHTKYYWSVIVNDGQNNVIEGPVWNFTTGDDPTGFNCGDSITDDRDGHQYSTIQIGDQCWMANNLNVGTKVNPGYQLDNDIIEKSCYNFDIEWCNLYGGLYRWDELMNFIEVEGSRGICPVHWHVPTYAELQYLINHLGGVSIAGGKLKDTLTEPSQHPRWDLPNTGATNSSGFSGLPGGFDEGGGGYYYGIGYYGAWWSSTQLGPSNSWNLRLYFNNSSVDTSATQRSDNFSLRCIKNY